MANSQWFITSFTEHACLEAYHIVLTTDAPSHLWLRWSFNSPQTHPRARIFRGLPVMGDVYYCFTAYHDIEQEEAGDTLTHTFIVSPWPVHQIRWFYFHGEIGASASPSTSCIFGRQLYFTSKNFFAKIAHPNDEAQYSSPSLLVCPGFCPNGLAVGRSTAPGIKLGAGIRFRDFNIPKCAQILDARLRITCNWTKFGTWVNCQISAEDTSTPDDWEYASVAEFLARWNTRIGVVNWDHIPGWVAEVTYPSPDVSATIQALVNRSDWQSGNPASFFWDDILQRTAWVSLAIRRGYSFNQTPVKCPSITIDYNHWLIKEIT